MVKVSELSIYDNPNAIPKPRPTSCTNVEVVVTKAANEYLLNPSRTFLAARKEDLTQLLNHVKTPLGIGQIVTIAGSVFVGRKIGYRILPMSPKREYTNSFKMAHYTIAGAVPLAAGCFWFETPRKYTSLILSNTALYSGKALYFVGTWTLYIVGQCVSFTFGAICAVFKGIFWNFPVFVLGGIANGVGSVGSVIYDQLTKESPIEDLVAEECSEPTIEESCESIAEGPIESAVELPSEPIVEETCGTIAEESIESAVALSTEPVEESCEVIAEELIESAPELPSEPVVEPSCEAAVEDETCETVVEETSDVIVELESIDECNTVVLEDSTPAEELLEPTIAAPTTVEMLSETDEPVSEAEPDFIPDPINPSIVEVELATKKRHCADEVLLTLDPSSPHHTLIEIEEDLGQSEESDKDMFPSRKR